MIDTAFRAAGFSLRGANGQLSLGYIAWLSIIDTAMLIGLMIVFLRAHNESPHEVFFDRRPVAHEARVGTMMIFAALAIGIAVLVVVRVFAPSLHNVEHNPLEGLIRGPREALVFAVVVVVAGGVREELQRAFVLDRFQRWLGGGTVGLIVWSTFFGLAHMQVQGYDAAIATGLLGLFWGFIYLRRRSVVAPMVSHSGFNLLEIAQSFGLGG